MPAITGAIRDLAVVVLACACSLWAAEDRARLRPLPKLDENVKTGPPVGSRVPDFDCVDQNGKGQTFDSLRGPRGLVLLFYRSADW